MRARLMATAAAVTIVTGPAFAADLYTMPSTPPKGSPVYSQQPMSQQSMVEGHLQVGVGRTDSGFLPGEDMWIFEGAGRANVDLGGFNVEIETGGGSLFDNGFSYSTIGAAGHLWTKLNNAAVGVFGAVNFPTGATVGTLGVEGETYLGAFTLGADGSYNWGDCGGGCSFDYWAARAWAKYYLTPDARLGGELNYANGSGSDAWGAAVDGEYRFSGSPFSLWAQGSYQDLGGGGGGDVWSGLFGFRFFMDGAGKLQQHDQDVPWDGGLLNFTTNFGH